MDDNILKIYPCSWMLKCPTESYRKSDGSYTEPIVISCGKCIFDQNYIDSHPDESVFAPTKQYTKTEFLDLVNHIESFDGACMKIVRRKRK